MELAAEGHLAVRTDRFYVAGGHCAEGFGVVGWSWGAASGSHGGRWCVGDDIGNGRCGKDAE